MKMAETLREQSISNRQRLDQIVVDSIIRSITEGAKAAAEKGQRTAEVSSSTLEELHIQERVKEVLEAEGFTVSFFTRNPNCSGDCPQGCSIITPGTITYHVRIQW